MLLEQDCRGVKVAGNRDLASAPPHRASSNDISRWSSRTSQPVWAMKGTFRRVSPLMWSSDGCAGLVDGFEEPFLKGQNELATKKRSGLATASPTSTMPAPAAILCAGRSRIWFSIRTSAAVRYRGVVDQIEEHALYAMQVGVQSQWSLHPAEDAVCSTDWPWPSSGTLSTRLRGRSACGLRGQRA